jgi:hypothetical protein
METTNMIDEVEEITEIENREEKIKKLLQDLADGKRSLSYSALREFRESPQDYIDYALREKVQTEAMLLGTVTHCLVWEAKEFEKRYTVMDDTAICKKLVDEKGSKSPRATNDYKAWKEQFYTDHAGLNIISLKIANTAKFMAKAVLSNRAARIVIAQCTEFEKKISWEYKNFKFTGYIDGCGDKAMADLKVMKAAKAKKAQRTIIDNWYYGQGAMYQVGWLMKRIPFYNICVDRKGGVSVHLLENKLIDTGIKEYEDAVDQFNLCLFKDRFAESFDFWSELKSGIYIMEKPAFMY